MESFQTANSLERAAQNCASVIAGSGKEPIDMCTTPSPAALHASSKIHYLWHIENSKRTAELYRWKLWRATSLNSWRQDALRINGQRLIIVCLCVRLQSLQPRASLSHCVLMWGLALPWKATEWGWVWCRLAIMTLCTGYWSFTY